MRLSEYGEKPNIFDYAEYMKDLNVHYADNPQPQKKTFSVGMKILREKAAKSNGLSSYQGTRKGREARKPWVFQAGFARLARDDGTDTNSTQLSTQVEDKRHFTQIHGKKSKVALKK